MVAVLMDGISDEATAEQGNALQQPQGPLALLLQGMRPDRFVPRQGPIFGLDPPTALGFIIDPNPKPAST